MAGHTTASIVAALAEGRQLLAAWLAIQPLALSQRRQRGWQHDVDGARLAARLLGVVINTDTLLVHPLVQFTCIRMRLNNNLHKS